MATGEKVSKVQLLFVQHMLAVRGFVVALMLDFGLTDVHGHVVHDILS